MSLYHLIRFGSFSHDLVRGRDGQGRLTEDCALCGFSRIVLGADVVKGPAHQQRPDLGARTTKAVREFPANVTPWRRSER